MLLPKDFYYRKIILAEISVFKNTKIKIHNHTITIYYENNRVHFRVPTINTLALLLIGDTTITTNLLNKFAENNISLFILSRNFRTKFQFSPLADGNVTLKSSQYYKSNSDKLDMCKNLVANKISNSNYFMNNSGIDIGIYNSIMDANSIDTLMGIEGNFAKNYFQTIFSDFNWFRRCPQSREDITNLLLDIGYTYLFNFVDATLRSFGFDTYIGFYHSLFFQRRSLACDVMEPFRVIIDRAIIKAYRLGTIDLKEFEVINGEYRLKNDNFIRIKYAIMFTKVITEHKSDIYNYVRLLSKYYRKTENVTFPIVNYK